MSPINYLLGIDGGGTKTEFLLTDLNGNEIKRVFLGASNPVNVGIENTKKILRQGIEQIRRNIDFSQVSVYAGIAGGITSDNKELIGDFLSGFGFGAYCNGSDADNALEIALKGGNGIVVIMGTGIVAFSQFDGVRRRIGGWGYLIDKGGSGFSFGADALNCAFKAFDCRDGSSLILKLVEKRLNMPLVESVTCIYEKGTDFVATFSPVIFEAFKSGDKEAERIIDRNIEEVAKIIFAGGSFSKEEKIKIVICGGMCKQKEILEPVLQKRLGERYLLSFLEEPIVNGAISLAEGNLC